jgi:hypothetical protein
MSLNKVREELEKIAWKNYKATQEGLTLNVEDMLDEMMPVVIALLDRLKKEMEEMEAPDYGVSTIDEVYEEGFYEAKDTAIQIINKSLAKSKGE